MSQPLPETGKARRTYEALLDATRAEIAESGSFRAEAVADRAGTSPATFYVYFPSKDDALHAVFSRALDELVELVRETLTVERLLEKGLSEVCRALVADACAFFTREALVFRLALAQLPQQRTLRASYREHQAIVADLYRRFLRLGQRAGQLRRGNIDTVATTLMVISQGFNNPLLVGREPNDRVQGELALVLERLLAP
ncbi:MAG: TetR/AcrR family transcriptional regulator [Proteobacteria bacterium]|nr:TetR/AcrR family transcriptional regulator [Pseudomonadota bacterium]